MHLQRGRVKDMIESAKANEGVIVCHDTLMDDKQAVCKGFAETQHTPGLLQVAQRLGYIVEYKREQSEVSDVQAQL